MKKIIFSLFIGFICIGASVAQFSDSLFDEENDSVITQDSASQTVCDEPSADGKSYIEYETVVSDKIVTIYGFHSKEELENNIGEAISKTYFRGIDSSNIDMFIELLSKQKYIDPEVKNFMESNNLEYCFYTSIYDTDNVRLSLCRLYKSMYFEHTFIYYF